VTAVLIAAVLAAGYGLGRLRPARRAVDWAAWVNVTSRWEHRRYRWPALAVMVVDVAAHPIRSYRNVRSWREPYERRTTDREITVNRPHRGDRP
jgi:hypothetical protein